MPINLADRRLAKAAAVDGATATHPSSVTAALLVRQFTDPTQPKVDRVLELPSHHHDLEHPPVGQLELMNGSALEYRPAEAGLRCIFVSRYRAE